MATIQGRSAEIPPELIAERANALWHLRGCPLGDPHADWEAAERELAEESAAAAAHPPTLDDDQAS